MKPRYWRYLFIGLLIFLVAPASFFQLPGHGVDPSYIIAIHLAHKFDLVFGRDVVFPFGPLGILDSRLPIGVNRWVYVLFDLYFLVSLFLLLRKAIDSVASGILWLLAVILAFYEPAFQWYFILFLFHLFYLNQEPGNNWAAVQATLFALLIFFYKVNLGVVAIFLLLVTLLYLVVSRRIGVKRLGLLLGGLAAGWLVFSVLLRVHLWGYLRGSLHLIDAYNDAMYLPTEGSFKLVWAAGVMLTLVGCWTVYLLVRRRGEEAWVYVLGTGALFILFKSGFVRLDNYHTIHFFKITGLFAAVLYFYSRSGEKVVCWLVLGIGFMSANQVPGIGTMSDRFLNRFFVQSVAGKPLNYWRGFAGYPAAAAGVREGSLHKVIGDHSVDVVPTEISTVYFNDLRYDPRPVIQSYSAYDAYLDSLNYAKYLSPGAPDYILFSVGTTDGRCAYFDEPKTKLAIFSHYAVVGEADGNLLLKKKELTPLKVVGETRVVGGKLGEDILVDGSSDLQYARIYVDYSVSGRVQRFLYHPPPLKITLIFGDGAQKQYRAAAPMLADGILLNKFIDSKEDFRLLMQSGGKEGAVVKAIRLDAPRGGFDKEIRLEVVRYRFPAVTAEDSADVAGLMGVAPVVVDTARCRVDTFHAWSEYVRAQSPLIQVEGWVQRKEEGRRVGVVLRAGEKVYALPSVDVGERPEIAAYYHWPAGSVEGFKATVSRAQLPPGKYQVGVSLYDSSSGMLRIRYLNDSVAGRAY
ncbi:MAG: hypothetical protein JST68_28650 [Bacteroidetes bacterium]|nr:hypothetical protein [Bacteroidota bacterium]